MHSDNQRTPRFSFKIPFLILILVSTNLYSAGPDRIVLVAGEVTKVDRVGHHDYRGGVLLLQHLIEQNEGVEALVIEEGWPTDPTLFDGAEAIVFYTDGAGKQAYLDSPERIAVIQKLIDAGVGLVSIHQAVEFTPIFADKSMQWIGAFYSPALSGRGHWDSKHTMFPKHPVTRGVVPWEINDGWLNGFKFPDGLAGITPLVWSGKEYLGTREGGDRDIVAWTYDRADGGRSFSFSGLDAHSAWEREGVRQLVTNGVLWTAGREIPDEGAKCDATLEKIQAVLTPRTAPLPKKRPDAKDPAVPNR